MADHESNGYQEDPWGDDDIETAGNKSSSRQEPFLSPDDGISFAGDSSRTDSVAHDPDAQTVQHVESGFNHDDQPAPDKNGKKAKVKKEKKPMSTAKVALLAGGGLFVLAIVGAGAFWMISQPSAPAPVHYVPRPVSHLPNSAKGSITLPTAHPAKAPMVPNKPAMVTQPPVVASSAMTNEAMNSAATSTSDTISSVGKTRSVTAPSTSIPSPVMGAAIPNSMTLPSAPASSVSASASASSNHSASLLNTQNTTATSNNTSSNQSVSSVKQKYQMKMAEMSAKIGSLKAKIDSEQKALDKMHHQTSNASPRVVYRTVVRYVPQPAPQNHQAPQHHSLPSGYTLAGGSGNSVLVKTPSGAYRTIRAGDTLNGQMVRSVHDGHVSMGE